MPAEVYIHLGEKHLNTSGRNKQQIPFVTVTCDNFSAKLSDSSDQTISLSIKQGFGVHTLVHMSKVACCEGIGRAKQLVLRSGYPHHHHILQ